MLAAHGAPHERTIARVELLDAVRGFDDFGSGEPEPSFFAHHERVAASGGDSHPAEASVLATDGADDRDTRGPCQQYRPHDLRDCYETGIRLLQANAARLEQQQHRDGTLARGALEQSDELRTMDFTNCTAHEAAFLRPDQHLTSLQRT